MNRSLISTPGTNGLFKWNSSECGLKTKMRTVRDLFLFGKEDGCFLGSTERRKIGVRGGIIQLVGRQGGGKIQPRGHHVVLGREPPLRSQEGVAFFVAVIEDDFQIRFVGIIVVLRADEGPV